MEQQGQRARRRRRLVGVGALAVLLVLGAPLAAAGAVPGTTAAELATGGVRYLDPIFAGAVEAPVEAAYDPAIALNRHHTLMVQGLDGTFTLTVAGATTAGIPPTATAGEVQAALQSLATVDLDGVPGNDVSVTGGPGGALGGNQYRVVFEDVLAVGTYPRITADAGGLTTYPGGSTLASVQCDRCLDIHQPNEVTAPAGGRPVVVLLHGGGFVGGAKDALGGDVNGLRMATWAQALAERGYVAVPINYTLSDPNLFAPTSCEWDARSSWKGLAQPIECPPPWYDAVADVQHDAQAAIRWLRLTAQPSGSGGQDNPYRINPNQISVIGESAGAFAALNVLYKPDDPGTVGVTTGSSAVSGGAAMAGMMIDIDQRAGAPPALLLTFTNDPLGELMGLDMYDESREVIARANVVGNVAELASYCAHTASPTHLAPIDQPEFADQVARVSRFLFDRVSGPAPITTPTNTLWTGGPRTTSFTARNGQVLTGGQLGVSGDFDGDGRQDVVWYGAECDTVWFGRADRTFFDPKETFGTTYTPAIDLDGAYTSTVGDFDGDGRTDIVWYDPVSGVTKLWYGNADRTFTRIDLGTLPASLRITAGDFDDNGFSDAMLTHPDYAGAIVSSGTATRGTWGHGNVISGDATGLTPVHGDFNGDGRTDVYWQGTTAVRMWFGTAVDGVFAMGAVNPVAPAGANGAPLAGDVDGDGADDLFWQVSGASTLWWGSLAGAAMAPGPTWSVGAGVRVAAGDVDGDGRMDLIWHSPTARDAVWYGLAYRPWAFAGRLLTMDQGGGVRPLVGNFDGDTSAGGNPVDDVFWVRFETATAIP